MVGWRHLDAIVLLLLDRSLLNLSYLLLNATDPLLDEGDLLADEFRLSVALVDILCIHAVELFG